MEILHPGRYIDPITDFGFKRLFGSPPNKDLLIDFLNAIFEGRKQITDLTYSKNELPGVVKENRGVIFDLLCTADNGEQFIIEVQKVTQQHFGDRAVFYTSSLICDQAVKGGPGWDYQLNEVWLIGIMDFCFEDTQPDKYLHDIQLTDTETHKLFYKKLGYIFLELPKFNKPESELKSTIDRWLFVLRNMHKLEKFPVFLNKSIFEKLFKLSEMSNLSKEDYITYIRSQMRKWDQQNILNTARLEARREGLLEGQLEGRSEGQREGRREGKREGRREGSEEERLRIARNMKTRNIAPHIIADTTGLDLTKIEQL